MSRRLKIAWGLVLGYFALVIVVQAIAELALFDLRELDRNMIDYAWQLELAHAADLGRWSGRDFGFARGPLFQLVVYWASRPRPIDPARTFAVLHAVYKLACLVLAFALAHSQLRSSRRPWARLLAFVVLGVLAYAVGIATFRALLSTLIIVSYLPAEEQAPSPSWKRAALIAALLIVALLHTFDRLLLGWTSIGAVAAYELLARWRLRDRPRIALLRLGRVIVTFGAGLGALALVGAVFRFHVVDYFAGQLRVASGYRSLVGTWTPAVRTQNVVGLLVLGLCIAIAFLPRRSLHWRCGAWLFGALPMAAFALGIPDQGHIYVGLLPLVAVLILIAFLETDEIPIRWVSGIAASTFALGWFGAFPGDLWASPTSFELGIELWRGRTRHTNFETDFGSALRWTRSPARGGGCVVLSPGMYLIHALADAPGPTLLRLRWTADDDQRLATDIRKAHCPHYLHYLRSFDEIESAEWQLGRDFLALAELYGSPHQISAKTYALNLRTEPAPEHREPIATDTRPRDVRMPRELRIPLDRPLSGDQILLLDYRLVAPGLGPMIGKLPEIDYRFERSGKPISEFFPVFRVESNHDASAYLAVDPEAVEWRFMLGKRTHAEKSADALVLRFASHGMLAPKRVQFMVRRLTALSSGAPLAAEDRAPCESRVELAPLVASGAAFARNVEPDAKDGVIHLHANPPLWHPAEVFARLRPCQDSCLYTELGIGSSSVGDGVDVEIHVIDRDRRPRLLAEHLAPGDPLRHIELPLWSFEDSDVLLAFTSFPGKTEDGDYAFLKDPRIARCEGRTSVARAISERRATATGRMTLRGDDLVLGGGPVQIGYEFRVTRDTCLRQAFEVSGGDTARWLFEAYVRVDDVDYRMLQQRVEGKDGLVESVPVSLHDWDGRDIDLVLRAVPENVSEGETAFLRDPRLSSCASPP